MEEYRKLMLFDLFEQDFDGMDRICWRLKRRISREAWEKVKDLFYRDPDCEAWLTLEPLKVIERLEDSEWALEKRVFQMIENQFSLTNREVLYQCLDIIRRHGGARIVELLRKAVKSVAGSVVKFSNDIKVLEDRFDESRKTEKIVVEKEGSRCVVFLQWMSTVDDAGFCGLVWKEEDVANADDEDLLKAVELDMAASLIFMPTAETVEEGHGPCGEKYMIKKIEHKDPIRGIDETFYRIFLWWKKGEPSSFDHELCRKKFASVNEARYFLLQKFEQGGSKDESTEHSKCI